MNLILSFILLIVGFVFLMKGADLFVSGSSKIALKLNVPEIVVGLTIVAMGTSAPEAAISITAAFNNSAGIAIGNVIGSNIMNVALILGISALIKCLPIKRNTLYKEIPFVIFITIVLLILGYSFKAINKLSAIILVILFICFLTYLYWLAKNGEEKKDEVEELTASDTFLRLLIITIIGVIGIVWGSDITVNAATTIAKHFGLSERFIGLTIIAFGTSLPELVTSIVATIKGKTDIAIGNIIGSNIFNILFVLGISGLVSPSAIIFNQSFLTDGLVAILVVLILFIMSLKNKSLNKLGAVILLIAYITYLVSLI